MTDPQFAPLVRQDRDGGLVTLTLDLPPVNAMGQPLRAALLATLQGLDTADLTGVILRGQGGNFVGGADLREFDAPPQAPHLPDVIAALERLAVPVVAVIEGVALGGGFELALGCDGRVADPSAMVGLPEVTLGLIPGAGGTLRLPRITGLAMGVDMICSGRRLRADQALKLGLVDVVADDPLQAARDWLAAGRKRLLRDLPVIADDTTAAEALALRVARGAVAVPAAIAAIHDSASLPVDIALQRERETSLALRRGPQSRALRHLFFAERQAGRVEGAARQVQRVGIVGAGRMGQGIALAFASAGYLVCLTDATPDALARGLDAIRAEVRVQAARGRMSPDVATAIMPGTLRDLASCDLVVEAIFEDMTAKQSLFAQLEAIVSPDAILATNTSYLDIDVMVSGLTHPERVAGLHFFNPAHVMRLVEVIRASATRPDVLASLVAVARQLRKLPVIARVSPGFIGNRIFAAYRAQAEFLLEEGAQPEQIDRAMRDFGMAMGPFAVFDLAGLDIAWAERRRNASARDPKARYVTIADTLCEAGRFGRKTGHGWYDYSTNDNGAPDPEVTQIILAASAASGLARRDIGASEIVARLSAAMVNTAAQLLSAGVAERASDIDLVLVNGYGYPRLLGGPLHHAAQRDPAIVRGEVAAMVAASGPGHALADGLPDLLRR